MPSKAAELHELPDEELLSRVESAKEELFNLRFQLATGQLDNPSRLSSVRHDVARILTVLRERHLEAELEEDLARADADSLERSREAQARGERKGSPLEVSHVPVTGNRPAADRGVDADEAEEET